MGEFFSLLLRALLKLDIDGVSYVTGIAPNPFSPAKKRAPSTKYGRYRKHVMKGEGIAVGDYAYGMPMIAKPPWTKGDDRDVLLYCKRRSHHGWIRPFNACAHHLPFSRVC